MKLSFPAALFACVLCCITIFLLRAFPFLLFSKRNPPAFLRFIEKYIPSMVIACLLIYCLKDIHLRSAPFGLPQAIALGAAVILHLWKNNAMLSIFGSTALFMLLNYRF